MKTVLSTTAAFGLAVFLFLTPVSYVSAQAVVRDSSPVVQGVPAPQNPGVITTGPVPPYSPPSPSQVDSNGSSTSNNLAYRLQQLQQEVLELRGLLEEQGFELRRLKQQRLDDYLDLDKRLGELSSQSGSAPKVNDGGSSQSPATVDTAENEKILYRKAIDQLLNQQDYPGAQAGFKQYLQQYPKGIYAPNVYYWQGQIYLTESDNAAAEQSFKALVDGYPDHSKAPAAKYKLATLYYDLGKKSEAKVLLEEVAVSNSDAAPLAKSFLSNQYK